MPDDKDPTTTTTTATTTDTGTDGAAPFVDDIVIWRDGLGAPRVLTADALEKLPKVATGNMGPINSLIQQGVVVAAIPSTSGIGAACYLVNLVAIKRPDSDD